MRNGISYTILCKCYIIHSFDVSGDDRFPFTVKKLFDGFGKLIFNVTRNQCSMRQNIRILLADDDADDRYFFRNALSDSEINADLTAVEDGQQLIDLLTMALDPSDPEVIFLDINMPGMDGKTCLREIRNHVEFAGTPIIMLSTSTRAKDIDETYRDGANMYISKTLFFMNSVEWIEKLFPSDWLQGMSHPSREKFAFT